MSLEGWIALGLLLALVALLAFANHRNYRRAEKFEGKLLNALEVLGARNTEISNLRLDLSRARAKRDW